MTGDFAVYLRKSRADQEAELRGEVETLARHRAILTELAKKMGMRIARIYQEIVSGDSIASRPQMRLLLDEVSKGAYKGVIVTEVERLARGDTIDQGIVAQAFRASNTLIVTPYRTYDPSNEMDEDYFEFSLFMARREYKAITRRMQAGRACSVKEGKYAGAMEVYGYKRVKLKDQKGWTLEIIPEQARVILMIFNWYAYGLDGRRVGKNAIANKLNEMGMPSPRGDFWRASSIGNLLRNDVLRGYVTWNKRVKTQISASGQTVVKRILSDKKIVVKGIHEAIVPQELFDDVARVLKRNPPAPASSGANLANVFAGLMYCKICGHAMTRKEEFGPVKARQPGLVCKTRGCPCSGVLLSVAEEAVLEALQDLVGNFLPEKPDDKALIEETEALKQSIKSLNEQLSRVYAFAERGIYDEATFIDRRGEITAKIENAKAALDKMPSPRKNSLQSSPVRLSIPELYRMCKNAEEKNALFKTLLSRVTYEKTRRCHRGENSAQSLTLELSVKCLPFLMASRTE